MTLFQLTTTNTGLLEVVLAMEPYLLSLVFSEFSNMASTPARSLSSWDDRANYHPLSSLSESREKHESLEEEKLLPHNNIFKYQWLAVFLFLDLWPVLLKGT